MKSTGIVRKLDSLGRLVIPRETLKTNNIEMGDPMEIFTERKDIILRKYQPGCYCCNGITDSYKNVFGRDICPKCFEEFKKQMRLVDELRGVENDSTR